nr:hypothetical protein [uncultured Azospirillum sp.]
MTPSDPERKIIIGALGLLYSDKPYRNHYRAPECGPIRELCIDMAQRSLLERATPSSDWFYVTAQGAGAVGHTLPKEA